MEATTLTRASNDTPILYVPSVCDAEEMVKACLRMLGYDGNYLDEPGSGFQAYRISIAEQKATVLNRTALEEETVRTDDGFAVIDALRAAERPSSGLSAGMDVQSSRAGQKVSLQLGGKEVLALIEDEECLDIHIRSSGNRRVRVFGPEDAPGSAAEISTDEPRLIDSLGAEAVLEGEKVGTVYFEDGEYLPRENRYEREGKAPLFEVDGREIALIS